MRKNNPQERVRNPIQIPEFTMPRLGIGQFFKNLVEKCRPGERCYKFEDGGPLGQYQGEQSQPGTEALFQKYYGQVDPSDLDPAGFDYYMYRNPEFKTLSSADRLALIKRMKNFLQYESGPRATQAEDVDTNTVFPDTPEQVDRRIRQNTKLQTNKDLTPKKPFGHGSYEYEDYKSGGSLPLAQKGLTVLARIDNWIDNAGKDVGKAITNSTDAILDTGIDQIPYVPAAKAFTNIFLEGRPLNAISNILKIPGGVGADFGLNVVQDHLEALENKYLPHTTDKTLDLAHEGLLTKIGLEIAKNKNLPGITEAPKQLGITQKDFNEYLLQNKDRILYKGVSYDTLLKELAKKYKKQKGGRLDTYQGEQSQPGTKDNSQSIDWDRAWDKIKNPGKYPAMETPTLNNVLKLLFTPALFKDLPIFQEAPGKQIIYTKNGGSTKTLKVRIKKPK